MYFRDIDFLGSMVNRLPEPENITKNKGFLVYQWSFKTDTPDVYNFEFKKKMTYDDMLDEWLEIFSVVFPKRIIGHARRIIYDLDVYGKYPSNVVLGAIYLVCEITNTDFKKYLPKVIKILHDNRKTNKQVTRGEQLLKTIRSKAKQYRKDVGREKITMLKELEECFNG